jgi:hypothetical protein
MPACKRRGLISGKLLAAVRAEGSAQAARPSVPPVFIRDLRVKAITAFLSGFANKTSEAFCACK